jgi:hypothetical protein
MVNSTRELDALNTLLMDNNSMKKLLLITLVSLPAFAADYIIEPGQLHQQGTAKIDILPSTTTLKASMSYDLQAKDFVPVPKKFLQDKKIMEFPVEFRTVKGYQQLEKQKTIKTAKAHLKFVKRAESEGLKDAYFVDVFPTNKKSKISFIYHPSLPDTGWQQITITMISSFPILDGYELKAKIKQ